MQFACLQPLLYSESSFSKGYSRVRKRQAAARAGLFTAAENYAVPDVLEWMKHNVASIIF